MAKRTGARLAEGTTLIDYASHSRIMKAFNNDMRAIRAEASRERSIIRKRIERMEKAGETYNKFYEKYGQNKEAMLPNLKNLSDAEVLEFLGMYAQGLGGGYQSTVTDIRKSREEVVESLRLEAEESGDEEFAFALAKPPTAKQMADVGRLMGMIQKVVGKLVDSGTTYQLAMKMILGRDKKESLLSKASRMMQTLGLDEDEDGNVSRLEELKKTFKANGQYRASYLKSRGKRG